LFPGFDPARAPNGAPWRRAAVLFMLYDRAGVLHTVFTRRAAHLANHRGQISLPGGAFEPADGSLLRTALRECEEELGIPTAALRILAELEPEYVAVSGFLVTPFVGRLDEPVQFAPDPREVEELIEVPVAFLLDPRIFREGDNGGQYVRYGPIYRCGPHEIWGATARMLRRILAEPSLLPGLAVPE
jgi:8-oxo-dGTP pyrophosphatase MutT (NUDIX family)